MHDAAGRGVKKRWHASWSIAHHPEINTLLQVAPIGDLEGSGGAGGNNTPMEPSLATKGIREWRELCGLLSGIARSGAWQCVVHDFVL